MIDLLQRAVYSPFFDKQSETEFLDAFYETVQALDEGVKKLIVYRIKMLAENRFENKQEDLTRQYEEFRFGMRGNYERIALQGFCENCKSSQNVSVHYLDFIVHGVANDFRVDCPSCNTKKSLFIKF